MPNAILDPFQVPDTIPDNSSIIAAQLAGQGNTLDVKTPNRRKKDMDLTSGDGALVGGKKRSKKELSPEEDPELIAVEALAFMCGGNPSTSKAVDSTAPLASIRSFDSTAMTCLALSTNSVTAAPNKRMRASSSYPDLSRSDSFNQTGSMFANGVLMPPVSTAATSINSSTGNQFQAVMNMRAITEADRVISGVQNSHNLAQPGLTKRPKSASADIYVPLCRAFVRPQLPANQLYGLSGGASTLPMTPPPLTIEFIIHAATKYEHFLPSTIVSWELALQGHGRSSDASGFVDSLMGSKDTAVKVIFSLIHCALFLQTEEGQLAWKHNYENYRRSFKDTLLVVVEQGNVRDEAKNQSLIATLPLAYFCVQKLMPRLGLRDNLCLFLALISCLEGRGKYHGRAGDNLPFAHKCYRYLVEVLGGKVFREIPEKEQSKADKELSKLFEVQTMVLLASNAATQSDLQTLAQLSAAGFQQLYSPANSQLSNMHVAHLFSNIAGHNLSNPSTAKLLLAHRSPYTGLFNPPQQLPFMAAQPAAVATSFPAVTTSSATDLTAVLPTNCSTQESQQLRLTSETVPTMPATS